MKARIVALATVLDVLVLVGLGLGLFFAPLTLIWAFDDAFSTDLLASWAATVDIWLLGHGVPLAFSIPADLADSLALGSLSREFSVDVALLGVGLLSVLWGYRIGMRETTWRHPLMVWTLAVGTMVAASWALVWFIPEQIVQINLVDALIRPALFLAAGLAIAAWVLADQEGRSVFERFVPEGALTAISAGIRAGLGAILGVVAVSALVVAAVLVASFSRVISLYESLQPGPWGIVALSIAQLALLPTVVIWAASVLVGPGFSLGIGALISPLGTTLQTVPALPILGILPTNPDVLGIAIIAVPVLVAVAAGALVAPRVMAGQRRIWLDVAGTGFFSQPLVRIAAASVVAALVTAGGGGVLAELASGQMGPGRFAEVGPDPSLLALWWGVEAGAGVLVGALTRAAVAAGR